jgi:four helix bundle protein
MTDDKEYKTSKSFEDLDVFQRAYKISLVIHRTSQIFPKIEQYALADQIRRASKSICANIAEGYGKQKQSKPEFKRFLLIALGSSDEMRVWCRYCLDLGFIDDTTWQEWRDEYSRISRMLQGLINKL